MFKKWQSSLIVLLITVFVTTNISFAFAANPKFSDVVGNPFRQQIEEVTAAGLLSGYPNGQFKPNNSLSGNDGYVTMLQLYITVVRGLGLESQAKNYTNSTYKYSPTVGKDFHGYLAVAADKKLLDANQISGLTSTVKADRMSVAAILATAFNIKSTSSTLPFADQSKVTNAYYRQLIAGIYENGIMSGDSQGNFRFNDSITREEYAVVLSRLINKGFVKPQATLIKNNKVLAFANNKIEISENYGLTRVLELANNCPAYINNVETGYSQLVNKQVDLYVDASNKVTYIKSATTSSNNNNSGSNVVVVTKESGRIDKVIMSGGNLEITIKKSNGNKATYTLGDSVKVYNGDKSASITDINTNAFVELELNGSVVKTIRMEETEEYEGTISKVSSSSIRVEKSSSKYMTFSVDKDDVEVTMDDDDFDYDDLETGYEVRVRYNEDDEAVEIEVLDDVSDTVEGIVTDIDTDDYEITIEYNDKDKRFDVDEDVDVSGEVRDWDDIEEDQFVELTLDDGDVVEIEVLDLEDGEFSGTVTDLDVRRSEITIETDSGYEHTFDVDDDEVDLDEIIVGSEVEVTVNDDYVDSIDVIDDEDIEVRGEIIDFDDDEIEISQDSGNEFSFDVDSRVDVYDEDDDDMDYDDLEEDMEVELTLEDGEVVEIRVLD